MGLSGSPEAWKRLAGATGMSKLKWMAIEGGWIKSKELGRYSEFYNWLMARQDIEGKPMHDHAFCFKAGITLAEWEKNFVPLSAGRDPNTQEKP